MWVPVPSLKWPNFDALSMIYDGVFYFVVLTGTVLALLDVWH